MSKGSKKPTPKYLWYECAYDPISPGKLTSKQLNEKSVGAYDGFLYGSVIKARSPKHAKALAVKRKMGEVLWEFGGGHYWTRSKPTWKRPSEMIRTAKKKDALDVLHAVIYHSFVATCCGIATGPGVLCDMGLVHETLHYFLFGMDSIEGPAMKKRLINACKQIEEKTPGSWGQK